MCAKGRKWRKQAAAESSSQKGRPGTGLGVAVSVSEKSNTAQISPSSSWRPKVGGGSSLLPVYKIFNVIVT